MRAEVYTLDAKASGTGAGNPQTNIQQLWDKWVQVAGLSGGTKVTLEGTIDGANWKAVGNSGAEIAADGIFSVAEGLTQIRVDRTTAGTGPKPTVTLLGRMADGE